MKQIYILQEDHPRLILFFAGWGADETPFRQYRPAGSDYLLCYDYRTLDFDAASLRTYTEIDVVGWSMGVWAASQVLSRHDELPVCRSIAINGTPFPIDELQGIPPAIYHGTLEGLTGASLHKFLRRMCADTTAFRQFLEVTPRRPLEELREELECIEQQFHSLPPTTHTWSEAIIGQHDRIIPPANQCRAWQMLNVPVTLTQDAHYQEALFKYYLQDLWKQPSTNH